MSEVSEAGRQADAVRPNSSSLHEHIEENIESVVALQRREWDSTGRSQRLVERASRLIGRPAYLNVLLFFILTWVCINTGAVGLGFKPWDPPPFASLSAVMSLVALITTTIVLVAQNRLAKIEQQHAHLDLQVNLLTEQKVTKLIHLIEELRRDLPMVKNRHDPQAAAMQERADTAQVLSAMKEVGLTQDFEHLDNADAPRSEGSPSELP